MLKEGQVFANQYAARAGKGTAEVVQVGRIDGTGPMLDITPMYHFVMGGFAFGMVIERLSMLKYGITDMRGLFDLNIKWLDHYGFSALDLRNRAEV